MAGVTPLVLVVDDNPDILHLTNFTLQHAGYRTESADSGIVALERAHALHPDLILLDLMMPEMDGLTVLKKLRADPATADIPIVMLSASDSTSAAKAAERFGADAFWIKGDVDYLDLRTRIAMLMRTREQPS